MKTGCAFAIKAVLYLCGLVLLSLVMSLGDRQNWVSRAAAHYFKGSLDPTPESQELWGMSEYRVFGRPGVYNYNTCVMTEIEPGRAEVVFPVWVAGTRLSGEQGQWIRRVHVYVSYANAYSSKYDDFKLEQMSVEDVRPLTFLKQAWAWLFWSLLGPTFLWMGLVLIGDINDWEKILSEDYSEGAAILIGVVSIPLAGYLAHVFFGSFTAIWVGILIYVLIGYIYYRLLMWSVLQLLRVLRNIVT
jgi:hypothetical protein